MKRLLLLALVAGCGGFVSSDDPPPEFDVRLSPAQYNELAFGSRSAEMLPVTCDELCVLPPGVFASGVSSCRLAVSNEGVPLLHCVPFMMSGE